MGRILFGLMLALCASTALAQDYTSSQYCNPWCTLGRRSGALDCSYQTYDQCLVSTRGTGGTCQENPFLSSCTRNVSPAERRRRGQN
jgi:hypothetical protein